jgi:integrase
MALPQYELGRKPTADVRVFGLQKRVGDRIKLSWIVRWSVSGRQRSKSFRVRSEAERYRAALLLAKESGAAFDAYNGEPLAWQPVPDDVPVHEWARTWLAEQWPEWQPRTRRSNLEALTRLVALTIQPNAPAPPSGVRAHLMNALRPDAAVASDLDAARWVEKHSLTLGQLTRAQLATVDQRLGLGDDGQPLSYWTATRQRKVSKACIRRAVDLGMLASDPWPPPPRGRAQRKSMRRHRGVRIRDLPNPATMASALAAVRTDQPASVTYQAMTAVTYYAGLRPSEVVMLRVRSLVLPATGWGRIDVTEADVALDEPGEPKTGARSVPIPPVLVDLLRAFVSERDLSGDSFLFRTRTGRRPTNSNWSRSWQRALRAIDHPSLRLYDCRHAAATTWLQAGVPLGEVARRLGHSVETLVSTYVGALAGSEEIANERIEAALQA